MKPRYEAVAMDAKGSGGGITIIWNLAEVKADYWIGMQHILTGRFRNIGIKEWFMLSAVYGPHIPIEKENFIKNIRNLNKMHDEKFWLIARDFNLITSLEEKKGGIRREELEMEQFRDIQEELHLMDIPTINGRYTWNNRRGGNRKITSHLDRFLATENLINRYVYYKSSILTCMGSIHWPIRLDVDMKQGKTKRPFGFEAFWLRDSTFLGKLKEWWKETEKEGRNLMHTFQLHLKKLKEKVKNGTRKSSVTYNRKRKCYRKR